MKLLIQKILLLLIICNPAILFAQKRTVNGNVKQPFVDSLDIKIGQMVMIGINDMKKLSNKQPLYTELKQGKIGGVVLFEKNITKTNAYANLKNLVLSLQHNSKIPLFISIDEEGGKVHRLKSKYGFEKMVSAEYLGNLDNADTTLFYNRRLAAEMSGLGINLNYAPSVDVAVNPNNPVIVKYERSFSADPAIVSKHAGLCIYAHREHGIKTVLKHFPGHGSSTGDSHLGIVDVSNTWNFDELMPYYDLLKANRCDAIMTAHIINKHWDASALPATLSEKVITGMLRNLLGFEGVIFSDDMQMHAISRNYGFKNAIKMAINAGVDILMFGNNVNPGESISATEVHTIIKTLVEEGAVSMERINESYNRIMLMKNS